MGQIIGKMTTITSIFFLPVGYKVYALYVFPSRILTDLIDNITDRFQLPRCLGSLKSEEHVVQDSLINQMT